VRVTSWPLTGLLTDAAPAAIAATAAVIAITVGLARFGTTPERQAARWLGLGLLWTALALTFLAPSLAGVVPGLPNDHYHAFADPMVFCLVGLGIGAILRPWTGPTGETSPTPVRRVSALVGIVGVGALLGWNLVDQPPGVHPDGGFPAAEVAARRILAGADGRGLTLRSLPDLKSPEAYAYPLIRAGATVRQERGPGPSTPTGDALVVICDSLFETAIGAPCGGPAEAVLAPRDRFGEPVDRFLAAPGRTISVYRPAP
jgi:hypothetical protein